MPVSEKRNSIFGRSTTMTNEVEQMMRGAIGGAALGGGIGGALFGLAGTVMVGLEPIVFMVCGIYAGAVYGGIVGALRGARTELTPAMVCSRAT
jgi:hypothetical protein